MKKAIIRSLIRTQLSVQTTGRASQHLQKWGDDYIKIGSKLTEEQGRKSIIVPEMLGVDSEMTGWSYFQLLEHNTIVNQAMSLNVRALMTGKGKKIIKQFNPKTDVLPQENSVGAEQITLFRRSITDHLKMVESFTDLKSKEVTAHPLFGNFNAHMWHGMISVHLKVHYKQLKLIVSAAERA